MDSRRSEIHGGATDWCWPMRVMGVEGAGPRCGVGAVMSPPEGGPLVRVLSSLLSACRLEVFQTASPSAHRAPLPSSSSSSRWVRSKTGGPLASMSSSSSLRCACLDRSFSCSSLGFFNSPSSDPLGSRTSLASGRAGRSFLRLLSLVFSLSCLSLRSPLPRVFSSTP